MATGGSNLDPAVAPVDERKAENAYLTKYLKDFQRQFYKMWQTDAHDADETIDNFRLSKTLGKGSFGKVLAATYNGGRGSTDAPYPRLVAVKIQKNSSQLKKDELEILMNEKRICLCVSSIFLMKTFASFEDESYRYLVMEYMPGGEFLDLLRRSKGILSERMAKFYASQFVLALQHLHAVHVVYRDLKPENVLIAFNGYIKLADFGMSKHVLGRTWTLCGTPHYMAPELLTNQAYGKSVDCWSLGICIYEMCAGYLPFDDAVTIKLFDKILACELSFPEYFSKELEDLLGHLIEEDITKRYGNLKDGWFDVINHPWFNGINFVGIHQQTFEAPWRPKHRVGSIVEYLRSTPSFIFSNM